jgi:hypothetical protein
MRKEMRLSEQHGEMFEQVSAFGGIRFDHDLNITKSRPLFQPVELNARKAFSRKINSSLAWGRWLPSS